MRISVRHRLHTANLCKHLRTLSKASPSIFTSLVFDAFLPIASSIIHLEMFSTSGDFFYTKTINDVWQVAMVLRLLEVGHAFVTRKQI